MNLFCDGGCLSAHPSKLGGTWAWVQVNDAGERLGFKSGVILPGDYGVESVSNNLAEMVAAIEALESVDPGWNGKLYTDSNITRIRLVYPKAKMNGIPPALQDRLRALRSTLGAFHVELIAGHPTIADLARGKNGDGQPVSSHNVFCDDLCGVQARKFLQARQEELWRAGGM